MSTIITIASGDLISNSRADINTSLSNLNTDKIETSVLDTDTTLAANSDSKIASQKATKAYVDAGGNVNASTTVKGIVEEATAAEVQTETGAGATGARLFINPSTANTGSLLQYFSSNGLGAEVANNIYCDSFGLVAGNTNVLRVNIPGYGLQTRTITTDWAQADVIQSILLIGAYVYALLYDAGTTTSRIYRYDKTNIAAGGTIMTQVTQAFGTTAKIQNLTSDPSGNFYMTNQAGASASYHIISKYSVSGTVMTFVSNTTCGSTSGNFELFPMVDLSGNFYGLDNAFVIRKYNSSGVLQWTSVAHTASMALPYIMDNNKMFLGATGGIYQRTYYQ